jgi:hypothetical protein
LANLFQHFVALLNGDYETVLALGKAASERFPSQPQAHFALRALSKQLKIAVSVC